MKHKTGYIPKYNRDYYRSKCIKGFIYAAYWGGYFRFFKLGIDGRYITIRCVESDFEEYAPGKCNFYNKIESKLSN